jgi:AcrR family transcriptional regulator
MSENTTDKISREFFTHGYLDYCNRVGVLPSSAHRLCKYLFTDKQTFYSHFSSLKELEAAIWNDLIHNTLQHLEKSVEYRQYSVREKMLSFYFTWFQFSKNSRAFVKLWFDAYPVYFINNPMNNMKKIFLSYINGLTDEGIATNEIASRAVVQHYYKHIFWLQFLFLLNFWSKDSSEDAEKTDAAVEKSTHLVFDLLCHNAGDTACDFVKFLLQQGIK